MKPPASSARSLSPRQEDTGHDAQDLGLEEDSELDDAEDDAGSLADFIANDEEELSMAASSTEDLFRYSQESDGARHENLSSDEDKLSEAAGMKSSQLLQQFVRQAKSSADTRKRSLSISGLTEAPSFIENKRPAPSTELEVSQVADTGAKSLKNITPTPQPGNTEQHTGISHEDVRHSAPCPFPTVADEADGKLDTSDHQDRHEPPVDQG